MGKAHGKMVAMSQHYQQELPLPKSADRILHMSDQVAHELNLVRTWARDKGIEKKLDDALEYARTFSGGPERDWMTWFGTDIGFSVENPSFVFTVYRRIVPDSDKREHLNHYMTIGMIWFDSDNDWSFHS